MVFWSHILWVISDKCNCRILQSKENNGLQHVYNVCSENYDYQYEMPNKKRKYRPTVQYILHDSNWSENHPAIHVLKGSMIDPHYIYLILARCVVLYPHILPSLSTPPLPSWLSHTHFFLPFDSHGNTGPIISLRCYELHFKLIKMICLLFFLTVTSDCDTPVYSFIINCINLDNWHVDCTAGCEIKRWQPCHAVKWTDKGLHLCRARWSM